MAYTDIDNPSETAFNTKLYVGNATDDTSITSVGFQPDWVWIKTRSGVASSAIFDSVRGTGKRIKSDSTGAEITATDLLTSFDSDGFTINQGGAVNEDGHNMVSWNWKEQAGVFDIVSYTGNGSNRTISHSLGSVPKMMIVKRRDASASWFVYHVANGNGNVMKLDNTEAVSAYAEYWNSTTPTSSVFSLGTAATANVNNGTFICYLFGNKQGVSKMGSYVGNGNANGTFVYTGFKPAWFMLKQTNATDNWHIFDNKRDPFNMMEKNLRADLSNAEFDSGVDIDFVSNGVKLRNTDDNGNGSGDTYIYMAFAENPFVTSTGVPATAR